MLRSTIKCHLLLFSKNYHFCFYEINDIVATSFLREKGVYTLKVQSLKWRQSQSLRIRLTCLLYSSLRTVNTVIKTTVHKQKIPDCRIIFILDCIRSVDQNDMNFSFPHLSEKYCALESFSQNKKRFLKSFATTVSRFTYSWLWFFWVLRFAKLQLFSTGLGACQGCS